MAISRHLLVLTVSVLASNLAATKGLLARGVNSFNTDAYSFCVDRNTKLYVCQN